MKIENFMQIILLHDIRGIGRKFEIKNVSDGYARNLLIPKKLATAATKDALAKLEAQKKRLATEHEMLISMLKMEAKQIQGKTFSFTVKTGEHNSVFGSVSKKDIEDKLKEEKIEDAKPELEKSIKTLGTHPVTIDFGEGIKAEVNVQVEPEE